MISMKRFGSLRRSKKRKEQDVLGGRQQSEASCLCGNPNDHALICKSSLNTHKCLCCRMFPTEVLCAPYSSEAVSMAVFSFTNVSAGSCLHTDLNGKAIYRGASELLPRLQAALFCFFYTLTLIKCTECCQREHQW